MEGKGLCGVTCQSPEPEQLPRSYLTFLRVSLLILRGKQTAQLCLSEVQQLRLNC